MSHLRKFGRLAPPMQRLFVEAWMLLLVIRLGLRFLPFQTVIRWLNRFLLPRKWRTTVPPDRIVWAVDTATRYQYGPPTCLPRALTAYTLFHQAGYDALLRIGVAHNAQRELEAHAWVEYEGVVVLGALPDLQRFNLLPSFR